MEENETFKINAKADDRGNVTINIFDILNNLSEEQIDELLDDGGWRNIIQDKMAESIISGFASENYNSTYHKLRTLLLNSEAMPEIIQMWAKEMIAQRYYYSDRVAYWEKAYRDLWRWTSDNYGRYGKGGAWIDAGFPRLPEQSYNRRYPQELIDEAYRKAEEWGVLFPEKENLEEE